MACRSGVSSSLLSCQSEEAAAATTTDDDDDGDDDGDGDHEFRRPCRAVAAVPALVLPDVEGGHGHELKATAERPAAAQPRSWP